MNAVTLVIDASLAPPLFHAEFGAHACESYENARRAMQLEALKPVLKDYDCLVQDGDLSDVMFVVAGQRLPAHRAVLAARYVCMLEC